MTPDTLDFCIKATMGTTQMRSKMRVSGPNILLSQTFSQIFCYLKHAGPRRDCLTQSLSCAVLRHPLFLY